MQEMCTEKERYRRNQPEFWKLTIGLALASFFIFANLYNVQPLLPIFSREYNVSPTVSSLSLSFTTFSLVISILVFGFFSDRKGRTKLMRVTMWLSIIPLIAIPIVDDFWWILLWRFISGITLAGLPAVAVAFITEEIEARSRGLCVSLFIASNALGGMAGRVLGGYFADYFSWQFSFYVLASIGFVINLLCLFLIPRSRNFEKNSYSLYKDLKGMAVHLKNPLLLFAFIFGMMLQTAFAGIWTYVPYYLENEPFNLTIGSISIIYFSYIFGVIGSPVAGRLSDHYGIKNVMKLGLIIMMVGILSTLIVNISMIVIGLSIICLGFFVTHSMSSTWVGMNASHHKSGATSLYLFGYYSGAAIGGTGTGIIWSNFGWMGVALTCIIFPLSSGVIFFQIVKKKNTNELQL
ncbi:MFS transporter [Virgibacillus sp. DJP39]|uniref:MFS transporter n=1 Tax=Virgibacillus sp. DJP39 TaxID=3409790 RepID=UPI003BB52E29